MAGPYSVLECRQIRLLTFQDDTGLSCSLSTHSIEEAPEYACLSYTWHDESLPQNSRTDDNILLGPERRIVGTSLHVALQHLGPVVHRRGIQLWVDAICINQDDFQERADQVRLMKDIFERASEVMAWIGLPNADEEMRLASEMMRSMLALSSEFRSLRCEQSRSTWWLDRARAQVAFCDDVNDEKPHAAWACIIQMLRRPYWSRTWVHQEATVSTARFYCGAWSFGWSELFAFNDFHQSYGGLRNIDDRLKLVFAGEQNIGSPFLDLVVARMNRALACQTNRADLSRLAMLTRQLRLTSCTDARDKVFAAIPHATDADTTLRGALLITDYNKDIFRVYTDLARYCLHHGRGLEILGFVCGPTTATTQTSPRASSRQELPSWVPDWRIADRIRPLNSVGLLHSAYPIVYNPLPGATTHPIKTTEAELHLSAIIFDKVHFVTAELGRDIDEKRIESIWKADLQRACSAFKEKSFNRTLVGDVEHIEENGTQLPTSRRGAAFDWDLYHTPLEFRDTGTQLKRRNQFDALRGMTRDRRAGSTRSGRLGMFGEGTEVGDRIAAFHGGDALYVIRETNHGGNRYEFVGECYVDGMMDGQVLDLVPGLGKGVHRRRIVLV